MTDSTRTPRKEFLKLATFPGASTLLPSLALKMAVQTQAAPAAATNAPHFPSAGPCWQRTWDAALGVLAGNIHTMPRYPHSVIVVIA